MAGGKGTRLASVTKDIPKPMVPIDGRPLLEYQIENLKKCGVTDLLMVVGHLGDVIRNHFKDGHDFNVNITYFTEETPLGTAGALGLLKDRLEEEFILVFGDLFINVDFNKFFSFAKEKDADITLFAHPNSHPFDSDILISDSEKKVTGWNSKHSVRTEDYKNLVNAGLYVVKRKIVDLIKENEKTDLEKDIIVPLIDSCRIFAYESTEYVKDLGTPKRLEKVTRDFHNGITEARNLSHKQKCIFLDRDGTVTKYKGLIKRPEDLELEDTAAEAIRLINESEYLAVIITNQPVIARGECSFKTMEKIHNRMYTLLGKEGAFVDGLFFCPHHPDAGYDGEIKELKIKCDCRKPGIGMFLKARDTFNIDFEKSYMIGDTGMDVEAGFNAGVKTIKLTGGDTKDAPRYPRKPDFYADSLLDAVNIAIKKQ